MAPKKNHVRLIRIPMRTIKTPVSVIGKMDTNR